MDAGNARAPSANCVTPSAIANRFRKPAISGRGIDDLVLEALARPAIALANMQPRPSESAGPVLCPERSSALSSEESEAWID
jgi:hypothetical protein